MSKTIEQTLNLTICSEIILTQEQEKILSKYGTIQQTITRKIFNELVAASQKSEDNYLKDSVLFLQLQKKYAKEYNVPVRVVKSCFLDAKAERDAIISINQNRIKFLETKIKDIKNDIKRNKDNIQKSKKKKQIKKFQETISRQKIKLQETKHELEYTKQGNIIRRWGGLEHYKAQWSAEIYKDDHKRWRDEWNIRRNHHLYFVGGKDESHGNQICQLISLTQLKLRLPNTFSKKYIYLTVDFDHKNSKGERKDLTRYLILAILKGQAITYRIQQNSETKQWTICATFSYNRDCNIQDKVIGIDVNHNLFTTCSVKKDGNPESFRDYKIETEDKTSGEIDQHLLSITKTIVDQAKKTNKHIAIERLDLENRKAQNKGKKGNRKLNMIPSGKFREYLKSYAIKQGVYVQEVNPAYTSFISKIKYMRRFGRTIHSTASYMIARRAMFKYTEKLPSSILDVWFHSGEVMRSRYEIWKLLHKRMSVLPSEDVRVLECQEYYKINKHLSSFTYTGGSGII